jgi:hypothetical protein
MLRSPYNAVAKWTYTRQYVVKHMIKFNFQGLSSSAGKNIESVLAKMKESDLTAHRLYTWRSYQAYYASRDDKI